MPSALFPLDLRLLRLSRLMPLSARTQAANHELVALVLAGTVTAVLTTFVDFRLGIPGHHIAYVIFPLALGFALVPRRLAGTIMSTSAIATVAGLGAAGAHLPGPGVLTGVLLTGPLLDLALRWGGEGWRLYGAFVAAGALANTGAFLVRGTTKYFGLGGLGGGRVFSAWLPVAAWTYAAAGTLAGLLSAVAWFRFRSPRAGS